LKKEFTFLGLTTGGREVRTDYIHKQELQHVLAALTPPNRLAIEISLATGLRIGDVLALTRDKLTGTSDRRITVTEAKTGKRRRVEIPAELFKRALGMAGKVFVFEGRHDYRHHRTRQAVHKDIKRAARLFRCRGNIAPHTARKVYAVEAFRRTQELAKVQKLLQHTNEAVTAIYALADELTARRLGG
jgi:integrase